MSDKSNRKKIDIYASTNNIYSKETKESDLYNISEFKSIDSNYNSVLAIPLKSCNGSKLYIYIPYKGERNFNFTYSIEDGRQMEGIKIYDDTCFDITLEGINSDDIYMNYRFVYQIKKPLLKRYYNFELRSSIICDNINELNRTDINKPGRVELLYLIYCIIADFYSNNNY